MGIPYILVKRDYNQPKQKDATNNLSPQHHANPNLTRQKKTDVSDPELPSQEYTTTKPSSDTSTPSKNKTYPIIKRILLNYIKNTLIADRKSTQGMTTKQHSAEMIVNLVLRNSTIYLAVVISATAIMSSPLPSMGFHHWKITPSHHRRLFHYYKDFKREGNHPPYQFSTVCPHVHWLWRLHCAGRLPICTNP